MHGGRRGDNYKGSTAYDFTQLGYKSSVGPSEDGRIKPDLISPGNYVKSAKSAAYGSGETCKVLNDAGTSMSSPGLAGASTIVRQYFREGVYGLWSTDQSRPCALYHCSAFNISGYMLKAICNEG